MYQKSKGLKAMRKVSGREPTYKCDNCSCTRYSPCGCMEKAENKGKDT